MSKKKLNITKEPVLFFTTKRMFVISILLSFLFYGNSISNGYSMDDEYVTTTDKKTNEITEKGIRGIAKIFTSNYAIDNKQNYEYRPIVTLSYAIEWSLFSNSEKRVNISHFINVILYGICGFLIFKMLQVLLQGTASTFSAIVVIIFLVHPIHSEVVNSLKNRDEILSLIFASLSIISIFKGLDRKNLKFFLFGLLFICLSFLSKRSSVPFLVIIPLMLWYFRKFSLRNLLIVGSVMFCGQIILKLLKSTLLEEKTNRFFNYVENPLFQMDFIARIPMYFYSNWFYFQKLLLPYPLSSYYGFNCIPIVGFGSWQFVVGLILIVTGMYFALKGFMQKSIVSFSILFFFLAIGGICNLIGPAVGIVAERFVFIGSLGFMILLTWIIFKWRKLDLYAEKELKTSLIVPILIIIIPSFFFNLNRNKDWNSKKSLYLADSKNFEKSAKLNSLLASEYLDEAYQIMPSINNNNNFDLMIQKADSAYLYFNRSISIYPNYESNLNNLGSIYFSFYHQYFEAIKLFKRSIKNNRKYNEGTLNLANSYGKIAQIYSNLEKVSEYNVFDIKPIDINKIRSKNSEYILVKNKFDITISLLNQFEIAAIQQLKNGVTSDKSNLLYQVAINAEKRDPNLKKIDFANLVNKELNKFLDNKIKPNLKLINGIRRAIFKDFQVGTGFTDKEMGAEFKELKEKYFDSSKVFFNKTIRIKPNFQKTYEHAHEYARIFNDLHYIIFIQNEFIKNIPNRFYSFQYIEIANSYYLLGNTKKSKANFKNAALELKKEKDSLESIKNPSQVELDRIQSIENELNRLKMYLIKLKLFDPIK